MLRTGKLQFFTLQWSELSNFRGQISLPLPMITRERRRKSHTHTHSCNSALDTRWSQSSRFSLQSRTFTLRPQLPPPNHLQPIRTSYCEIIPSPPMKKPFKIAPELSKKKTNFKQLGRRQASPRAANVALLCASNIFSRVHVRKSCIKLRVLGILFRSSAPKSSLR